MSRTATERIQRLKTFMDSLPDEARSKCSLCTTTLTHIVKQAEAETGAGTTTVARALAEKINETALPADRVTEGQLRDRVRRSAGEKESGRTAQIKETDRPVPRGELKDAVAAHFKKGSTSRALRFAEQAIGVLENIADDDPDREEAFSLVVSWINAEVRACNRN